MTKMKEVRPRLDAFVDRMRTRLAKKKNQKKSDWREGYDILWLFEKLEREVQELKFVIYEENDSTVEARKKISHECADVANFAMMISDIVEQDDWC